MKRPCQRVTPKQDFKSSMIEAMLNTAASMAVFAGFGLSWEVILGLTLSMFLKNIGIRRIFTLIK